MRYALSVVLALCWGVWLGGILGLFVAVTAVFDTFDRETAGRAGLAVFRAAERYQVVVAPLAAAAAGLLAVRRPRGRARVALFAMLVLAATGTAVSVGVVTPRIVALHAAHETGTPEFRRAHGLSMAIYSGQALALALAGLALPAAVRDPRGA